MLVLTMDRNNSVTITAGEQVIIVQLLRTKGVKARIGFAASKHVKIMRTDPIIGLEPPEQTQRPPAPKPSFPPSSGTMTKGG